MSATTRVTRRSVLSVVADVATGLAAALLAVALFGSVHVALGPVDTTLTVRPAWSGSTSIAFVPFGAVTADTPTAPAAWTVEVVEVRGGAFQQTFDALGGRGRLPEIRADAVTEKLAAGARRLAVTVTVAAVLIGAVAAAVLRRRVRSAVLAAATAAVVCGTVYLWSAATLDADAFDEPRARGALAVLDRVEGFDPLRPRRLGGRLGEIESEGLRVVRNLVGLYYGFVRPGEGLEARRPEVTERVLVAAGLTAAPNAERGCRAVATEFDVAGVVDVAATGLPSVPFVRRDGAVVPYVTTGPQPGTDASLGVDVLADSTAQVGDLVVWGGARPARPDAPPPPGQAALAVFDASPPAGDLADRATTVLVPGARFDPDDTDGTRVLSIPPASVPGDVGAVCSVIYVDRANGAVRAADVVTLAGDEFDVDRRTFVVPAEQGRS